MLKHRSFTFRLSALRIPNHLTCLQEIQTSYMQAGLFISAKQQGSQGTLDVLTSACVKNTVGCRLNSVVMPEYFILEKAHKGKRVACSSVAKVNTKSFGKPPYATSARKKLLKYPEKEPSRKNVIFLLCFNKVGKSCSIGLEASRKYYLNQLSDLELGIHLRKLLKKFFSDSFYPSIFAHSKFKTELVLCWDLC